MTALRQERHSRTSWVNATKDQFRSEIGLNSGALNFAVTPLFEINSGQVHRNLEVILRQTSNAGVL